MKNLLPTISFLICTFMLLGQTPFPITCDSAFQDDFESGSFQPAWSKHPNINGSTGGRIDIVNGAGLDNTFGVLIGKLFDDANFTTNALDLHLDLSDPSLTNVELTFWIADKIDEAQADDGIYFSDDGGVSFKKVLDFFPDEWCDFESFSYKKIFGQHPPIDVDQLAEDNTLNWRSDQFVVRFQQTGKNDFSGTSSSSDISDGFYLDNVNVYDPKLEYAKITCDEDYKADFDLGYFDKSWAWNFADETATIATGSAITSPMSIVGVSNQVGLNGTPGVLMGRRCDGVFTTNALDLHLNLSDTSLANVEMTFWIADKIDETQADDGIYFSDDGGVSFKKVLDLFPDEWCDFESFSYKKIFGQHPPIDVDQLAEDNTLNWRSDQFVVRFQQTGQKDFSGTSTSPSNSDGFYLDNVHVYDPKLEYAKITCDEGYEADFDLGYFDKSWAWNFADETATIATGSAITSPMSIVHVADQAGLDGTPGVLMGRRCDGVFTTNALDLHLDLSDTSLTNVEMTFLIADKIDETQADDGIYFSDDGGVSFKKVLDLFPDEWCDFESFSYKKIFGQHPPIDVDQLAEDNTLNWRSDQFVIRFQQTGQDDFSGVSANNSDGFYLDKVHVYDPKLEYATLPFEDDFELGSFKKSWAWNFADKTSTIISDDAITNPMSIVEIVSGIGYNGSTYAVRMGKICDGTYTTNALDLHLNLMDHTQVSFSFYLNDIIEETQSDDGIYFSDNGGESFEKVYTFDFESTNGYQFYQLNVDSLAVIVNLELSDSFIIRFQQRGQNDFSGSAADGFLLDDVNIKGTIINNISGKENELQNIKVVPNPATNTFSIINIPDELINTNLSINIYDIVGRLKFQSNEINLGDKITLNVSTFPTGLYHIVISDKITGSIISKKILKN